MTVVNATNTIADEHKERIRKTTRRMDLESPLGMIFRKSISANNPAEESMRSFFLLGRNLSDKRLIIGLPPIIPMASIVRIKPASA